MRVLSSGQLQPDAAESDDIAVTSAAVVVAAAAAENRLGLLVENPAANTATMFFRWDADPTTSAYSFSLPPGERVSIDAAEGDYTQGALRVISDTAGAQTIMVTLFT